jgi:excinuclease UvrABC nuclease subunit
MYFPEQELSYPTTPACHRYSFRQCLGPCAGRVTLTDYQSAAAQAERIVAGESTTLVSALERRLEALIEALAFEEASLLYEEIQTVQWTVSLIARCHERRRKLTFVYPAQGEGEALHWYIIRQGKVLRVAKAPTTGEEAKALRTFLRQIAKGEGTLPLAASENTSLVVSWFRLHPELRNDTLSLREAIRQCTAVIGPVARRGAKQT